jgi:diketogulonate reductase-like aldo/keto reductase
MKVVTLADGTAVPALGLGTWRMGERAASRAAEVDAVKLALDIGYRLVDTAEMYGEGGAEKVLGQALAASPQVARDSLFVVSKVYPHNATRAGVIGACERSLERLGLDYLDLYLLHWPGQHPLAGTVAGFEALRERGLIRRWGVSNFDTDDMARLWATPGGDRCVTNQVYYSLSERGCEFDLKPWLEERGVPLMAYSPIDQGTLARSKALVELSKRLARTPAQLALAWLMRSGKVMVIPKAVSESHLRENFEAGATLLDDAAMAELDRLFPGPSAKEPLAML